MKIRVVMKIKLTDRKLCSNKFTCSFHKTELVLMFAMQTYKELNEQLVAMLTKTELNNFQFAVDISIITISR